MYPMHIVVKRMKWIETEI